MELKRLHAMIEYLGPEYSIKTIDRERCVYRKLNDIYDIEVSGVESDSKTFMVCIWGITNGDGITAKSVEYVHDIKTKEQLKSTLECLSQKYRAHPHQN